jgi:hypothetical protein
MGVWVGQPARPWLKAGGACCKVTLAMSFGNGLCPSKHHHAFDINLLEHSLVVLPRQTGGLTKSNDHKFMPIFGSKLDL